MYKFEKSIFINLPPKVVFNYMNNPTTESEWPSGVQSSEWISNGPPGLGSRKKVVRFSQGESKIEITEWDPPNRLSTKSVHGRFRMQTTTTFEEQRDGTLLTLTGQFEPRGLFRLFEGENGKQIEKQFESDLADLKKLLDAGLTDSDPSEESMENTEFGATSEAIQKAASALGVTFPKLLEAIWRISNGLDLPRGWRLFAVFDESEPKATAQDIVYENTTARSPNMPEDFVSIAANKRGDQLVLRNIEGMLIPVIYLWEHKTNRYRKCHIEDLGSKGSADLAYIRTLAKDRVAKIEKEPILAVRALARFVHRGEIFSDAAKVLLGKANIDVRLSALDMMKKTALAPWEGVALQRAGGHEYIVYEHWSTVVSEAKRVRDATIKILSKYRKKVDESTLHALAGFDDIAIHQVFFLGVDYDDSQRIREEAVKIDCSRIRDLAEAEIRRRG